MSREFINDPPQAPASRSTEHFYSGEAGVPRLMPPVPRRDGRRLLAFLLIGLGLAMLLGNLAGPFAGSRRGDRNDSLPAIGEVKTAQVDIRWGAGSLDLGAAGAGDQLVSGSALREQNVRLDVDRDESEADISINSGSRGWFFGRAAGASGDIRFNPAPTYEFDIRTGLGASSLDLSRLQVSELELRSGMGSVDLRLPAKGPLHADLRTGVGSIDIALPPNVEARVKIHKGAGSFDPGSRLRLVEDERGDASVYQTPGFANARDAIDLEIHGGLGSVDIK